MMKEQKFCFVYGILPKYFFFFYTYSWYKEFCKIKSMDLRAKNCS